MPRLPLHPASGTGIVKGFSQSIRLVRYGCANRPFYHIVVMGTRVNQHSPPVEQIGSYDPLPNMYNEKLVAFNFERVQYWLGEGAKVSKPVAELLGIAGFFPIHPKSYINAWRKRQNAETDIAKETTDEEQSATSSI